VRTKLKDNSMFVCFAPRENPKIAIAVVVENAGYGATWAGPIAALMMEKFLNDTLRPERLKEVERIAAADLLPGYLIREQFKQDSIRAYNWFKMTKDTSVLKRFLHKSAPKPTPPKEPVGRITRLNQEAILPARQKISSTSNIYRV
jgi:penicillin-binding protein 2